MDHTLEEFCSQVLDLRRKTIVRHDLERTAVHIREVVQPKLAELERLQQASAAAKTNPREHARTS